MTAGAFKTGTHDDLATALGLAVLQDKATGGFQIGETSDLEPDELDTALGVDPSVNILKVGF